jgi:hypothetical protein
MHISVTFIFGFGVLILAVAVAVAGMMLVRRRFDIAEMRMDHDVADPLLSVIGTLFSILLGFLVAGAIQRFDEARMNVQEEAGAVADVFRCSQGLPQPVRSQLQQGCINYVNTVVDEEWKLMETKSVSQKAWDCYSGLWRSSVTFNPSTDGESNVHQMLLSAISRLGNFRTLRFAAMTNQLPLGMWIVVLLGGAATISFTYFFEVKSERVQVIMTALVAMVMALNIFLLANYDYPFSGDVAVAPTAFLLDRQAFGKMLDPADGLPKPH